MDERKEALKRRTKAFASAVVRFYIGLDKGREEMIAASRQQVCNRFGGKPMS